jgi:predicted transcriptional regulator
MPLPTRIWSYRLSPYTVVVFSYLLSLGEGRIESSRVMAKSIGISRQRCEDSLAELLAANIVGLEKVRRSGRREINRYFVRTSEDWLDLSQIPATRSEPQSTGSNFASGMVSWE